MATFDQFDETVQLFSELLEGIQHAARASDADDFLTRFRDLAGNLPGSITPPPPPPVEVEEEDTTEQRRTEFDLVHGGEDNFALVNEGLVNVSLNDQEMEYLEKKLVDQADDATYLGTEFAVQNDGTTTPETVKLLVLKTDVEDVVTDVTNTEFSFTYGYRSHLHGSQTILLSAEDWRARVIHFEYSWDNEPTDEVWPNVRSGVFSYTSRTASGLKTVFTVNMGGDLCTVFIDCDDGINPGRLQLTSVNNGNFGDIVMRIGASEQVTFIT